MSDKCYILILNWNGWQNTIECLESVFRLQHPDFQVVVCDNDSANGSLDYIAQWAEGRLAVDASAVNRGLAHLVIPPVNKPLPFVVYDRKQAENGGGMDADQGKLIFIQNGDNLGFAGGNNVGLRYIIRRGDYSHVWLLNNDTLVDPGALGAMVRRVAEKMEYGICGSTLMHYHDPGQIQALGGATYSRLLARPQLFAPALAAGETLAPEDVERRIDYVHGASMLVTRSWIENAGLMSEDYFLYFEELDWIRMAKGKFMIAYAESSVVYHKSGESIGTSSDIKNRSYVCDYYFTRNRLLFTRKYYPLFTPVVCLVLLSDLFRRILRGQPDRARMIASLLWGKNDRGGGRDKR